MTSAFEKIQGDSSWIAGIFHGISGGFQGSFRDSQRYTVCFQQHLRGFRCISGFSGIRVSGDFKTFLRILEDPGCFQRGVARFGIFRVFQENSGVFRELNMCQVIFWGEPLED